MAIERPAFGEAIAASSDVNRRNLLLSSTFDLLPQNDGGYRSS